MRICCIISSLAGGGAERVISLLANEWAALGRAVTIVTLASTTSDVYDLAPRVQRVGLDVEVESRSPIQAIAHNARKVWALRRAIVSVAPDVVISFVDRANVLTLLSCVGLGIPVVVSERVHPVRPHIGRIWSLLREFVYPRADALVIQSEAMRGWAETVVPPGRIHVIANPVRHQLSITGDWPQASRRPIVLGVGRLVPQKGFDVLIKAFHTAVQRHPEWSLAIVGEGPREAELKELATTLLPPGSVSFLGTVKDPERYYAIASLFVLPSRFEGFPNALVEAMAAGCAVIAADSPGAMAEIVRHGIDGLLIPPEDVTALALAMDRLMTDEGARNELGSRAVEVATRFGVARILALWEHLICKVYR